MKLDALNLKPEEVAAIRAALPTMTVKDKMDLVEVLEERERRISLQNSRNNMIDFARRVYPGFKVGPHHRKLAKIFQDVVDGKKKRVIINIAPRMGKSEFSSYLFPAFFLGNYPDKKIIMGTHTASLSEDFGRRVRNLLEDDDYNIVFPGTKLAQDQKASGKWSTDTGGQYYAAGVGGALAGRGADLFMIDDPHSEQDVKANSRLAFDTAWSWFQTGPLQRLMPNGAIIVVMCMTGDTPVLMADGTSTQLKDIRPGDRVATFDKGRLGVSKINNWRSSGVDSIYRIQTQSGIILRANERHPFLVMNKGVLEWTRLKNLRPGMLLVATKDALGQQGRKLSPATATHVRQLSATVEKTPTLNNTLSDITGNGQTRYVALTDVKQKQKAKDFAKNATEKHINRPSGLPPADAKAELSTGTESRALNTTAWWQNAATSVTCVVNRLLRKTHGRIGTESCASTTTTTQVQSEGYSATTATLQSGMEGQQAFLNELRRISDFTTDQIVSITSAGKEEVFDVEVDRTENFIANGVVSHNTRWGPLDLTGRLIDYQVKNPDSPRWEIVELPAILNEGTENEKSLWPEQWPLESLKSAKSSMDPRYWNAQYMQQPTSDTSAIISRKSWRIWPQDDPPPCDIVLQSWDTAFEAKTSADYSACTTWGVFYNEEEANMPQLILLDAFKDRIEFPELKEAALKHYRQWEPDILIVEKKAAGAPLIQELRRMGIPVDEFSPSRGNDKIVRVNAIADIFASGNVWAPDTRWAREVIEEVATFPVGENDDYVDCVSLALARFRQGGLIGTTKDEIDTPQSYGRRAAYY